jgi:hypothetical protein
MTQIIDGKKISQEIKDELREQVTLLRRSKIVIGRDGNNTLLIPNTLSDKSN